ncbi:Zinc finger, CCHC-type superfamily [Sesbania bispinosa]|nr:Zinc finger, CCHC-type superfamily [Sesbania bispinosa]
MTPTLTLGHAYHLVAEDEQQRLISTMHKPVTEAAAFQAQSTRYRDGAERKGNKKEKPKCDHCQKVGHTKDECYEIIGYPPDWRRPWVIDSGATEHITYDENLLKEIHSSSQRPVQILDGTNVPVKGSGKAKLPNGMEIDNVLHIPEFQCNLLSISKLTREYDCALTFVADLCVMQDLHSRNLIGVGRHQDGLYLLEPVQNRGAAMKVGRSIEADLWHSRLGHASESKLVHIGSLLHVIKSQNGSLVCLARIHEGQLK